MTKQESINIKDMTDYRCKECKKDWTKCGRCPVMMDWVKEQKVRNNYGKRRSNRAFEVYSNGR